MPDIKRNLPAAAAIAIMILFAAAGCTCCRAKHVPADSETAKGEPPAPESSAIDEIHEAVFRSLFEKNASGMKDKACAYYISIGEEDPSDSFLARFEGHAPPVRKASGASANKREGVVDKVTGERGLRFTVGEHEWLSDTHVKVEATYYEAGLSAAGYTFELKLKGGNWVVTSRVMNWIS